MKSRYTTKTTKAAITGLMVTAPLSYGAVVSQTTTITIPNSSGTLLLWDIDGTDSRTITGINYSIVAIDELQSDTNADAAILIKNGGNSVYTFFGPQNAPVTTLRSAAIQLVNVPGSTASNLGNSNELGPNNFQNTNVQGLGYIQSGQFSSGANGYIGFKFKTNGGTPLYGWAEITFSQTTNEFSILQWAYEDDGSIDTGLTGAGNGSIQTPIPEPAGIATGLAVLALGAAGLRRWRKAS